MKTINEPSYRKIFLIITICLSLIICIFKYAQGLHYETNDDVFFTCIMGGSWGDNLTKVLVYPTFSCFLTSMCYFIQNITHFFDVYGVMIVLLTFLAFVNLSFSIYNLRLHLLSYLSIPFLMFVVFQVYTFTVVSAFLISSSIVLLYSSLKISKNKIRIFVYILFALSAFLGICLRIDCVFLSVLTLFPLIIDMFVKNKKIAIYCVSMIVFCYFSFTFINNIVYNSNEITSDYYKWSNASSSVRDYPLPEYDDNKSLYDQVGWTNNDRNMIREWYFADKKVFSTEALSEFNNNKPFNLRYLTDPILILKNLCVLLPVQLILIVGILFLLKYKNKSLYDFIVFILSIVFPLMVFVLLIIVQRAYWRIMVPATIFTLIQYVVLCRSKNRRCTNSIINSFFILLLPLSMLIGTMVLTVKSVEREYYNFNENKDISTLTNYIQSNPNNVYISSEIITVSLTNSERLYQNSLINNMLYFGSCYHFSPSYYEKANQLNIKNPDNLFLELVSSENTYVTSYTSASHTQVKLNYIITYLKEHYNVFVTYSLIKELDNDCQVYKFFVQQ